MEKEVWKETDYPGYWVSTFGNVENRNKRHKNNSSKVSKNPDKDGYLRVSFRNYKIKEYNRKTLILSRVVAKAFCEGFRVGLVVNHKDGNKQNNHYKNLEWISAADNERHARKVLGKRCVGEKASRSKLRTIDVLEIRGLHSKGMGVYELSELKKVSRSQIIRIIKKLNWSHV